MQIYRALRGGVLLTLLGTSFVSAQANLRPALYGATVPIDKTNTDFAVVPQPTGSGYVANLKMANPAGGEFRLFFDKIVAGSGRFDLVLVSAAGTIGKISSEDLTAKPTFASDAFRAGSFTIKLIASQPPSGSFHISQLAYEQPGGAALSVSGTDQRVKAASLGEHDHMRMAAHAVAKLEFREGADDYVCTGFLVGPDRLLTNHHCLGDPSTCATAIVIFGYVADDAATEQAHCVRLIKADATNNLDILNHSNLPKHDFALVQLDRRMGDHWGVLTFAQSGPADGERVYIPQHPDGRTQEISEVDCVVVKHSVPGMVELDSDFSNTCDTEGGASGSPVLDFSTDQVVGLHHLGFSQGFVDVNRAVRGEKVRAEIFPPPS